MKLFVKHYEREDVGSGDGVETSGDCDDEDGCDASGEEEAERKRKTGTSFTAGCSHTAVIDPHVMEIY